MLAVFYCLIILQILQGLYALAEGFRWLGMVRKRLAQHPGFYAPRVALICPCKGSEVGLEQNLTALTQFDYPDYEIFFTLASAADPAHAVIQRVAAKSKRPAHIVIAGAPAECGEKVNNLRAAIEQVGEGFEVLVFADSDGRPGHGWLRHLVAPLADPRLGASTTFRWYLPEKGGLASAVAAAWNAPIATLLGDHTHNFCWGGGMAIRRKVFEGVRALEFWQGAASDDYALTRALRHAGRRIHFVPECLTVTLYDTTPRGLLEFTNRQIIITRVYSPRLWALGAIAHLLYCVTMLLALFVLLAAWFTGGTGLHIFLLMVLVLLLAAGKGYLRLAAVGDLLPEWRARLLSYAWVWIGLAPAVPFLYLWNSLVATFSRRITWRGVTYELVSPNQTRVVRR